MCIGWNAYRARSFLLYQLLNVFTLHIYSGAIDFKKIYDRIGVSHANGDILSQVEKFSEEAKAAAHQIIYEEEMFGCGRMQLRSDLHSCIQQLQCRGISLAVSTRNCADAFDHFLRASLLPADTFSPVLSRDSLGGVNKPNARVAEHIMRSWEVHEQPERVWFVGDSEDDIACGRSAGCMTCLIRTPQNKNFRSKKPDMIHLQVDSLSEFVDHILQDMELVE